MNNYAAEKLQGFGLELPTLDVPFATEHLAPAIGTVIRDVDLRQELSDEIIEGIRRVLVARKVIFFEDQAITTEQHLAFGQRFGELEIHPFASQHPQHPEVLAITHGRESKGQENLWHSDVTWRQQPSLGSILRAIEVPTVGGDTLFCCMETAYQRLPDAIKEAIEGKTARHDFTHFRAAMIRRGASEEAVAAMNAQYPNPDHPVVRTHPESGRKSLYVNRAFTLAINGMEPAQSEQLLAVLYHQASHPEYQCRFKWRNNSIAFWDNRACQHYAASDYWPAKRQVERVTIIGDTPV